MAQGWPTEQCEIQTLAAHLQRCGPHPFLDTPGMAGHVKTLEEILIDVTLVLGP
jgi:hypothetical protein